MNQPQQRATELAYLQLADLYIGQMHQAQDAWRATDQAQDRDSPAGVARQQRALAQLRACVIGGQLLPAPRSLQEMDGVCKAALLQYRAAVRLLERGLALARLGVERQSTSLAHQAAAAGNAAGLELRTGDDMLDRACSLIQQGRARYHG